VRPLGVPPPGSPHYDSTDVYVLNGNELLACPAPSSSPSCSTGGTHATKVESFLKIKFNANLGLWTVWSRDGTQTTFSPVFTTPSGTLWWGQTSTVDTHGNTVTYTWACPTGEDCYPDTVQFGPYSVKIYRETRTDVMTLATGHSGTLRKVAWRLHSILIDYSTTHVRGYGLDYVTSTATGRSLLKELHSRRRLCRGELCGHSRRDAGDGDLQLADQRKSRLGRKRQRTQELQPRL
jgi:hypothetical protein